MNKTAVILGTCGQDASYLAELLLEKNYKVYGMIRRSSSFNTGRIDHIRNKITLIYGDVTDLGSIINILKRADEENPNSQIELYNLAAQSHVQVSCQVEKYTAEVDGIGVLYVLQAIKILKLENRVRFYQASTSELFGNTLNTHKLTILNEDSPMEPISPYAIAKLYAYHLVKYYRQAYNIFCVNGILFNHTSPRRGENFVCKKIADYFKNLKNNLQIKFGEPQTYLLKECKKIINVSSVIDLDSDEVATINLRKNCLEINGNYGYTPLQLGNLNATRDFGYAKDYVQGMWLMLQQEKPKDYVLSTGRRVTVREFVDMCCENIGLGKLRWEGEGINEKGYFEDICLVEVNSKYYRPVDLTDLIGDSTKAREELGWKETVELEELVNIMINT